MEYTEQEIEMLARFLWRSRATMTAWEALHESERDQMRASVRGGFDEVANAAARLMREVREHGAKDASSDVAAAWDALHDDRERLTEDARAQGALDMRDKVLAVVARLSAESSATVRKNGSSKENAFDEGAACMAANIGAALEELSPSEYERGAADMRERAALAVRRTYYAGKVDSHAENVVRSLPLAPTTDDAKASKLALLRRQLSDAGERRDEHECDRIDAEIEAVERGDQ